jgi:hypothetical protein
MNRLHGAEASFRMLIVAQLLKKFSDFFGTWRFIAVFTGGSHWFLFWARWIHTHISCSSEINFYCILLSTPCSPKWFLSFRFFQLKFRMHFCFSTVRIPYFAQINKMKRRTYRNRNESNLLRYFLVYW